jgi:hypothetical protein
MDEYLKKLTTFLQDSDEAVVAKAAEICKDMTSIPGQCAVIAPLLPELLKLSSSGNIGAAEDSLIALINITSDVPTAIDQLIGLNACSRIMDDVISCNPSLVHERLMLLTNITTQSSGCLQILDLQDQGLKGQRLLRLAVRFAQPPEMGRIPRARPLRGLNVITDSDGDEFEYAAMVLMNATLIPEGREIFFSTPDFFMPVLLDAMSGDNPVRKRGIIGVMRNLCFEQSRHEYLLKQVGILRALIKPLISKSIENNAMAAEMLQTAFPGIAFGEPEPLNVNRRNILETLLLLALSSVGRSVLVQHSVVFVMKELDEYETDEENKELGLRISAMLMKTDGDVD